MRARDNFRQTHTDDESSRPWYIIKNNHFIMLNGRIDSWAVVRVNYKRTRIDTLEGEDAMFSDILIEGNHFSVKRDAIDAGAAGSALFIENDTSKTTLHIKDNIFDVKGKVSNCIAFNGYTYNTGSTIITGNKFYGALDNFAISYAGSGTTTIAGNRQTKVIITNNEFYNMHRYLRLVSRAFHHIAHNYIYNHKPTGTSGVDMGRPFELAWPSGNAGVLLAHDNYAVYKKADDSPYATLTAGNGQSPELEASFSELAAVVFHEDLQAPMSSVGYKKLRQYNYYNVGFRNSDLN